MLVRPGDPALLDRALARQIAGKARHGPRCSDFQIVSGVTREDILGCLEFARDLLSITAFYPDKLAGMQRAERLTLKEWLLADGPRIEDHELPWFDRSYRRGRKPPE